jgi:DNA excision repair protein ERCC-4
VVARPAWRGEDVTRNVERPTIVVDTREQRAFTFPAFATVRRKLDVGDYAVDGMERTLCVERKELNDAVHWLTVEHDGRCAREIQRAKDAGTQLVVVIEASRSHVAKRLYEGVIHPNSVLGAIRALWLDKGVPVLFCADREGARDETEAILLRVWEHARRAARAEKEAVPA